MRNQPLSGEYHILDQITVKNTTYVIGYNPERMRSYTVLRKRPDGSYRSNGDFGTEAAARRRLFQLAMDTLPKREVSQIVTDQVKNTSPYIASVPLNTPDLNTIIHHASERVDKPAPSAERSCPENHL